MTVALLVVLSFAGAGPLVAQHTDESHGEEAHGEEAHHHKNHIGLFLGVTDEEAETEATIGVDYERRLGRWFGVGALVELVGGDSRELIVGVPVFLHATDRLKFIAAVGYESQGPFEDEEGHHEDRDTVLRLGVEYAFHVGDYSVSPTFDVDFVEHEEILVYGVTIGRGF